METSSSTSRLPAPAQPLRVSPWQANYLLRRSLAVQLRAEIRRRFAGRNDLRVVDVGCGVRPYEHLFEGRVAQYVGVDARPGPFVDVVAMAEDLPFTDGSFDCLLSNQLLEHAEDPTAVLKEFRRILVPGGIAMVSTHGVVNYHPNPDDYWRWTHTGLARLFRTTGSWSTVDVIPNGGTATALSYLVGRETEVVADHLRIRPAIAPVVMLMNVVAWNLDRVYRRRYPDRPPDLSPNFLAVGVASAANG